MSASAGPERDQIVPSSLRVFINYRREDSADAAGRLYDSLSGHFANVFMDIDTIEPGVDFVDVVHDAVGSCDVLLALIGRHWLTAADPRGRRRLDEPNDFVGLEIKAALDRDVRVIPVLLQGAEMPGTDDLPTSLQKLARRNAFEISQNRWRYDVGRLIDVLEGIASQKPPAEGAPADGTGAARPVATFEDTATTDPETEAAGTHVGRRAPVVERAGVDENGHQRRPGRDRRKVVAGVVAAVLVIAAVGVAGWNATRPNVAVSPSGSVSPSGGICSPVPGAPDACPAAQLSGTYLVKLTPLGDLPSTDSLKPKNKIWGSADPDRGDRDSWSGQEWYFTPHPTQNPTTVVWTVNERPDVVGKLQRGGAYVSVGGAFCGEENYPNIVTRTLEFTESGPDTIVGSLKIHWVCPNPSKSVQATFDVTGTLLS